MIINPMKDFQVSVKRNVKQKAICNGFFHKSSFLTDEWTEISDFITIFKEFTRNHLHMNEIYTCIGIKFKLSRKENIVKLAMCCKNEWYYYSKLEAAQTAHKFDRILARCDLLYSEELSIQ